MKTVLVIEDDPIILHVYKTQIEKAGFQVTSALNGEAGLQFLEARPDAILLDLMLPKMDGVELLKRIRAREEFAKTPIFVFTNVYLSDLAKEATKAGATSVFDKSIAAPQDIILAIRKSIEDSASSSASGSSSRAQDTHSQAPGPVPESNEAALSTHPDLVRDFLDTAPETILLLRKLLQALGKSSSASSRLAQLASLSEKIHALTGGAAAAGLRTLSQMSAALEALLRQLTDKPEELNPSSLRTLSHAIDFLDLLFRHDAATGDLEIRPIQILVVDDESISRMAIVSALEKARLKSVDVDNPQLALRLLKDTAFDLIFLDVSMPDMNGFDLCREARKLPLHKTTPVVFVTSSTDFESRSSGALSGGNDLIAKPFLFTELTVKALNYALKSRFANPDSSMRNIPSPMRSKPNDGIDEVVVFGDNQDSPVSAPPTLIHRKKSTISLAQEQQPSGSVPRKSVFAVIKNSFPAISFGAGTTTTSLHAPQPALPDGNSAAADALRADPATEKEPSEKPLLQKQSLELQQAQDELLKASTERQQAEERCLSLEKGQETLRQQLEQHKQAEEELRKAYSEIELRLQTEQKSGSPAETAQESAESAWPNAINQELKERLQIEEALRKELEGQLQTQQTQFTEIQTSLGQIEEERQRLETELTAVSDLRVALAQEVNESKLAHRASQDRCADLETRLEQSKNQMKEAEEKLELSRSQDQRSADHEAALKTAELSFTQELAQEKELQEALRREKSELQVLLEQNRTELHLAQRELTQAQRELAERSETRKGTGQHRYLALETERNKREILQALDEELPHAAHQLVRVAGELLETTLTTRQRSLVESAQSGARSLLGLHQTIIGLSKSGLAPVNRQPLLFDLCAVLEEATEPVAERAKQNNIPLALFVDRQAPPGLHGDRSSLCEILAHLLRSTLKLTKNGPILLQVTKEHETDAQINLRFAVSGIAAERAESFQRRLLQGNHASKQTVHDYEEGELDIAVGQQLVGMAGGRFGLEFTAHQGSTLWFTMPFTKAGSFIESTAVGLRVLVVEENQAKRDLLQTRLETGGVRASTAANAVDALSLLRREATEDPFKVALVGAQFADMNALTLAKVLKGDPTLASTTLLLIADDEEAFQHELYRDAGFLACVSDPLRQAQLFNVLRQIGGQSQGSFKELD